MIHFSYAFTVKQTPYFLRLKNFLETCGFPLSEKRGEGKNFVFITESHEKKDQDDVHFKIVEAELSLFDTAEDFNGFIIEEESDFAQACEWIEWEISRYFSALEQINTRYLNSIKSEVSKNIDLLGDALESYLKTGEVQFSDKVVEKEHPIHISEGQTLLFVGERAYLSDGEVSVADRAKAYAYVLAGVTNKQLKNTKINDLKTQLNQVLTPLIVLDKGEPLWFNEAYKKLDLNPSTLLAGEEAIVLKDKKWKILSYEGEYQSVLLFPQEQSRAVQNNEDLGIISSSIAHELNNPLGGILAALDVLLLDEHAAETEEMLINAKKTVWRCKNLVGTFLGFSRKELIEKSEVNWKGSVDQAFELMRFRLIENNFHLKIDYKHERNFPIECNPSVLTMVLYLLLNELMTAFSHDNLVRDQKSREMFLRLFERGHRIDVELEIEMSFEKIKNSPLISQLLALLDLVVSFSSKGLSIKKL